MGFVLTTFLSVWVATTPAAAITATPPKAALVIGNADYASVGRLKNPANDALDMCEALKSIGYQATCLVDVDTRTRLRSLIEDFVEGLPDGAVIVVYYAGHAVQADGENYLVPTAARLSQEADLVRDGVSLSYVMRQLRRTSNYLTIMILDACRNNPLAEAGASRPQGLAQITDIPDGTEVLYATAANEPAMDGVGRNGTLTKHLLARLHEPGTIDDFFKQVSLGVQSETQSLGHLQKPAVYTNFAGQYCLVRCTDRDLLQAQRQQAEQRVSDLEARVAAGDQAARTELSAAVEVNRKLQDEIRKKDADSKAADAARKDRENKAFVPPAF
jgi:uncharacterized caspase-like protein